MSPPPTINVPPPHHPPYLKSNSNCLYIQGRALHESAIRFSERFNMDQCVGAIDGTYVPIRRPLRNPHAFINRKGFYSLNVLVGIIIYQKRNPLKNHQLV